MIDPKIKRCINLIESQTGLFRSVDSRCASDVCNMRTKHNIQRLVQILKAQLYDNQRKEAKKKDIRDRLQF